tara:strand:+ start:1410 stop:1742 length:333 start_codon:yes stop_codon:yes gene_type:complete
MKSWILLVTAIVFEVIATSNLKSSDGFTKLVPSLLVIIGYGIAFYSLSLSMKSIPVGIAYAVWSGMGITLVTLLAWHMYAQKPDFWGIVGMSLILIGILVMNLLSESSNY